MSYTVGFIGLGHMGLPMAKNLLKSESVEKLYVYDLMQEPMQECERSGAVIGDGVAHIAQQCDIVFTMLQTGNQVAATCLGEHGLFNNAKPGLLFIDCSSIDVDSCLDLHQAANKNNIKMLDAPVSGGVKGAEQASLTIMVGGEQGVFEQAQIILNILGKNIIHAGDPSTGQVAKICNNMILGITMIGVSEAFNLGEKLGLKAKNFFDIASKGSGECWALTKYCPSPNILPDVPSSNHYQPGFTAEMMLKDLRLSQKAANSVGVSTPLGANAESLYSLFANSTHKHEDFSAIIRFLNGDN
jgi:3-hydroxyisobutyrate dehydrogenase